MKKKKSLAAAVAAVALTVGLGGALAVSAAEWSWANYGFSGTAIANPDPFDKESYLIGGYVTTVNHLNPLPGSYEYDAHLILDTEGVAIRFRFSWVNTEPGYKAVADLADGIAIYPMDESLDIAIVTEGGVVRYSFPTPGKYDYMKANHFRVWDDGETMAVMLCEKTVARLSFSGTRTVGGKTCYTDITVTDGDGYVYGRLSDPLVLREGGYVGYSSQKDRALILVEDHSLAEADIDFGELPAEKETTEGWVPETEPRETEPAPVESDTLSETAPVTETVSETVPETADETPTETDTPTAEAEETQPESLSASETTAETKAEEKNSGCGGVVSATGAVLLSAAAAAVVLSKKRS